MTVPPEYAMAMPESEVSQTPPVVISERVIVNPSQTDDGPVIASGFGLTVTGVYVTKQPLGIVYVTVAIAVPENPVRIPEADPIVATPEVVLHIPPAVVSVKVKDEPT